MESSDINTAIEYENQFYWTSTPNRMAKLLAQYELYKEIIRLPGAVVETGVFKATTLIRLASFRHFFETAAARPIYAFDAFGSFPQAPFTLPEDVAYASHYDESFGIGLSRKACMSILQAKGLDENVHLVEGDITQTMPTFFSKYPHVQLAFVHVDVESYEATQVVLAQCWPRLVNGGIMALDDHNNLETGAPRAIIEFFSSCPSTLIEKFPFSDAPAYIQKK